MDLEKTNANYLPHRMSDCGRLQIRITLLVSIMTLCQAYSFLFMSFGAYTPGWTCLDNTAVPIINGTESSDMYVMEINQLPPIVTESCQEFEGCQHVRFNQEASTIVTEWELVCDKAWIPTFIISVQMAGIMLGHVFSGYLGNKFGKWAIYSSAFINALLNSIIFFSTTWEIFVVIRFFTGFVMGAMSYVLQGYVTELVLPKWRERIASLPIWSTGALLLAVTASVTKDWRQLQLINTALSFIGLLSVILLPGSLECPVKRGKREDSCHKLEEIAKWTKFELLGDQHNSLFQNHAENEPNDPNKNQIFELFRKKTRMFTVIMSSAFMCTSIVYTVTSFSISLLPGDLYANLLIIFSTELLSGVIARTAQNTSGRNNSSVVSGLATTLCILCAVVIHFLATGKAKLVGLLASVVTARVAGCALWHTLSTYTFELYPTAIGHRALSFFCFISNLTGIFAPCLIPSNPEGMGNVYLFMAVVALVSSTMLVLLPETKDSPLQGNQWDDKYHVSNEIGDKRNEILNIDYGVTIQYAMLYI